MQETTLKYNAENILEKYLEKNSMRRTEERRTILRKAMAMEGHFGVEDLYAAMEEDSYHVSLTTIYASVDIFCRCGLLRKLAIESRGAVYEVAESDHAHLVCTQCGKVSELKDTSFADTLAAARPGGYVVSYVAATVYGLCPSCVRRNRRRRKNN